MRINLAELGRQLGRKLTIADTLALLFELNYGGWQTGIERTKGNVFIALDGREFARPA
jgi:hypothetical protein